MRHIEHIYYPPRIKRTCVNEMPQGFGIQNSQQVIPNVGSLMDIDISSPQPITDVWGISAVDASVNGQKATNSDWRSKVSILEGLFVEPITGSTSQWALYKGAGSDGYNIVLSEVTARGQNIATLLGGVGNKTYGYGFFQDALAYIKLFSPQPSITVSFDLIRPVLNGSYVGIEAEIDYVVSACNTATVTIRDFQLCYEMGLAANNDVFANANAIGTATQIVVNYITATYPTIKIGIDAYNSDDLTLNYPTLNAVMNALTDVDYVRQYFQFDKATYELNRSRVAELSSFLDKYLLQFTHGQKIRLAQSVVKTGNALLHKAGEGLIYSELFLNVVKQNILRSNLITDYVQYNISNLVANNGVLFPAYYFMQLVRGAMKNDGMASLSFTDVEGSDSLVTLPTKKGSNAETYIINPSPTSTAIAAIQLNGVAKQVATESWSGNPTSSSINHYYVASGASSVIAGYSLTKISTL